METMKTVKPEATKENIDKAINDIKQYAADKGYQFLGELKKDGILSGLFGGNKPKFESKKQEKVCRNYLERIERKMGMATANKFLHFLYKKIYKMDECPRVEYSEQELKIKAARKAWRTSMAETAKLQAIYKESKKGFYKK
jgi:hypothetical protein